MILDRLVSIYKAKGKMLNLLFGLFDGRDWEWNSEDQGVFRTNFLPFRCREGRFIFVYDLG